MVIIMMAFAMYMYISDGSVFFWQGESEDLDQVVQELRKQYLTTVTKIKGQ